MNNEQFWEIYENVRQGGNSRTRTTGMTYRQLLRSLIAASQGKRVIYLVDSDALKRWTTERLRPLIQGVEGARLVAYGVDFRPACQGSIKIITYREFEREPERFHGGGYKVIDDGLEHDE